MKQSNLKWIENGIALEEMEKKSRGWELIKIYIERRIKKFFEDMLKDDANMDKLKGKIKMGRDILNYPQVTIKIALEKKKELDELEKRQEE